MLANTLHSPSSIPKSQLLDEPFEFRLREGFGKNVGNIVVGRDVLHVDTAVHDGFTNEMIPNIDVLRARVKFVVFRERNSTLIVAIESGRFLEGRVKLAENRA